MVFKRKKEKPNYTCVDNSFIKGFMPLAPELALKAYLYGLMLAETGESADIADALGAKEEDIRAALNYLEAHGLVEIIDGDEPQVIFKPAVEGFSRMQGDARYSSLISELSAVLGTRVLSGAELAKIYDWVEVFGFTTEAAVEIVRYSLDKKGARTSVAYMDKLAKTLAGRGAFTGEDVRNELNKEELVEKGAGRILRRWGQTRSATEDEIALYEKWTQGWGMDDAALDYALTQMTAAEKPNFKYLDGVVEELYRNGDVSAESVSERMKREDTALELARQMLVRMGQKGRPDRAKKDDVRGWYFEKSMSAELIMLAADIAKEEGKNYPFVRSLMEKWHEEGISSVSAAREYFEGSRSSFTGGKKHSAMNYMHGKKYSEDELKKLGISLGEEFYEEDGQ